MSGALCHYGMAGEEQARLERSKRDGCAEHGIDRAGAGVDAAAESAFPAAKSSAELHPVSRIFALLILQDSKSPRQGNENRPQD